MRDRDRVCVGAIAGAFGVKGEARLKSFTDHPDAIADYGPLETEDGARSFDITITRTVKDGVAARLSGVKTREDAEALKSTRLYVPRERLPAPDEDEFYYTDLIGLSIETPDGRKIGRIKAVQDFGAGDMLEYAPQGGGESLFLPFTREIVPTVDLAGGRVIAEPPADAEETPEEDTP